MSEHKHHEQQDDQRVEHNGRQERLINLNKIEVFLGICVAVVALASAVGTWYVLPYRMSLAERSIAELRAQSDKSQELLIRVDERLRSVQRALKIPTDANP